MINNILKKVSFSLWKDFTFLRALYYFWTPMFFITWRSFGIDQKSLIQHAGKTKWQCEPSHFFPLVVETDVVLVSLLLWWRWKLWLHWYWKTSHWSWMKASLFPLRWKLHLVHGKSISFLLGEINFKILNSWKSSSLEHHRTYLYIVVLLCFCLIVSLPASILFIFMFNLLNSENCTFLVWFNNCLA